MRFVVVLIFVLGLGMHTASADVPTRLEYQGYLTDLAGSPIDCNTASDCTDVFIFTFSLHDAITEGDPLWTEVHYTVEITNGVFHVELGAEQPIDAALLSAPVWLQIRVNDQAPMTPRQRVVSAPYALRASISEQAVESENAVSLGGVPAANYVQVADTEGFITEDGLVSLLSSLGYEPGPGFSLSDLPADLQDGDNDSLAGLTCATGEILGWNGSQWACTQDNDTNLTESALLIMLAANGFQPGNLFSGNWGDLAGIPAGFADGTDADSLGTLSCSDGAIAQWDGTNWVCSDAAWAIPTAMEAPCTVETEGHIYLDSTANGVRVCDGTTYQLINFCTAECPDTSTFACGLDVIDTCGRACGTIGTALNITLCGEASSTTCGSDVVDDCDNSCGDVGTLCSQGVCQNDSCCGDGVLSGSESCDDGNNTADDGCSPTCTSEGYEHFTLTGTPNPAQVLNTIDRTFYYPNNLVNGIWHRETNRILSGHYSNNGYWSHPADSGGYAGAPDNGTGAFARMVHMPATGRVIHTDQAQYPSDYDRIYIGNIIQSTGLLENFAPVVFDDDFSGKCNLISSSAEHFLCYTENTVRWYKTDIDSTTLVHTQTIILAPAPALCDSYCYGGTFAWDGAFYYFAEIPNSNSSAQYRVYNASGNLIATHTSTAGQNVNSVYFDWSVGRYAVHDGFGYRNGGSIYGWGAGEIGDDSQTYSPVSSAHSL